MTVYMTQTQIDHMRDWAKSCTKKEALDFLRGAGILDENGDLTEPYR